MRNCLLYLLPPILGQILTACKDDGALSSPWNQANDDTAVDDNANTSNPSRSANVAFSVPERVWDLAEHPDGSIVCSTQSGSKVYYWDPQTDLRTETRERYQDIQFLLIPTSDETFFTTTEYGVTGTLSVMRGAQSEVLHSQAADGTLLRMPMDFVPTDDGGWIIADYKAEMLFVVSASGSVSTHESGSSNPEALLLQGSVLYVAGEDGIFAMDWPNGAPEKIDDRQGHGLTWVNGELWSSNSSNGVFVVEGTSVGLNQAGRPSVLLSTAEGLYFADQVGEDVWFSPW